MQHNKDNKKVLEHKIIYVILCWAFGFLGVHRFYEKKIFSGIIYLLTFGVLGIGVIIDFTIGLIDAVRAFLNTIKFYSSTNFSNKPSKPSNPKSN